MAHGYAGTKYHGIEPMADGLPAADRLDQPGRQLIDDGQDARAEVVAAPLL